MITTLAKEGENYLINMVMLPKEKIIEMFEKSGHVRAISPKRTILLGPQI